MQTGLAILGSGGVAGVVAPLVSGLLQGRREQRSRTHEDKRRQEEAHAVARERYLPLVVDVQKHIYVADYHLELTEDEAGIAAQTGLAKPKYECSWADVIGKLMEISVAHPSADVRDPARELARRIDGTMNYVVYDDLDPYGEEPYVPGDRATLASWGEEVRLISEAMHTRSPARRETPSA
ncbi:hypothetical protein [Luteipulveratus halotolerans]|uniref:hypothetical protein n=1 Tax=Luteipulveratus halotolerans TaxID=1631356 RepID=UPI0012FBF27E|nr:hypothetical protein [Luteipulveratus halotolerans]